MVGAVYGISKGGGGVQPDHDSNFSPGAAADVLKARFIDRSKVMGVDLENGHLTYTSPAALAVGSGEFPYKLSAQLVFREGEVSVPPVLSGRRVRSQPQIPWTTNWNNNLSVSGSGLEAMGQSDPRAATRHHRRSWPCRISTRPRPRPSARWPGC